MHVLTNGFLCLAGQGIPDLKKTGGSHIQKIPQNGVKVNVRKKGGFSMIIFF